MLFRDFGQVRGFSDELEGKTCARARRRVLVQGRLHVDLPDMECGSESKEASRDAEFRLCASTLQESTDPTLQVKLCPSCSRPEIDLAAPEAEKEARSYRMHTSEKPAYRSQATLRSAGTLLSRARSMSLAPVSPALGPVCVSEGVVCFHKRWRLIGQL